MRKIVKVIKKIINVICWMMVIVFAFAICLSLVSRINGTTPSLFGYSIYRVSSGSMQPELEIGDVILDVEYTETTELEVGDIITYRGMDELKGMMITHQIIKAPYTEDAKTYIQTKGTANPIPDPPITLDRVESVMVCELSFLNTFYDIFFSPWGFLLIVGLLIIIFVDEIINIVKIASGNDKDVKHVDDINDIIERLQNEKTDDNREE